MRPLQRAKGRDVRGFGGPQVYFALERLMQRIAATLGLRSAARSPSC
jgi:xanthine dehydrogenase molybdopterin-binding subunit B